MLMLLIALVRGQLLDSWRARLAAPDAPNYFLINIQPDERAGLGSDFPARARRTHAGARAARVRARLTAIDDVPVSERVTDERGRRFVQRESNLTWTATLSSSSKDRGRNVVGRGDLPPRRCPSKRSSRAAWGSRWAIACASTSPARRSMRA